MSRDQPLVAALAIGDEHPPFGHPQMVTGAAVLTHAPLVVVMVGLLCAGPGLPLTLVPLTSQVVGGAPPGTAGVAGGLFNAARQLGGALGVAVLGAFVHRWSAGTGAGWALIVAGAAAVVLWGVVRPLRHRGLRADRAGPVRLTRSHRLAPGTARPHGSWVLAEPLRLGGLDGLEVGPHLRRRWSAP